MRLKRWHLLAALTGCALLYAAGLDPKRAVPAVAGLAVQVEGAFTPDGEYPVEPYPPGAAVRRWGSWSGSDANQGRLTIGPFRAPAVLRVDVSGYPSLPGNELHVEHLPTGARFNLDITNPGERWQPAVYAMPREWHGDPVALVAADGSTSWGGWLAVTEPIHATRRDLAASLAKALAAWSINGLLLGALWFAAARSLLPVFGRNPELAPQWLPLIAAAAVAAAGYAVFWAYFAHPIFGKMVSAGLVIAAGAVTWRAARTRETFPPELLAVGQLALVVGTLYLAVLHLFPAPMDLHALAANRFRPMPGDNTLSHVIAGRLYEGANLKTPLGDWLASDRPPLQSGWQLLTWPVLAALKIDAMRASGTAALWLQLTWIAAAHGLLRTLGLGPRRSAGWVAALALSGFFLLNTTFTWPKLAAAAFTCGAFALWVLGDREDAGTKGQKDQGTTAGTANEPRSLSFGPLVPSSFGLFVPATGAVLAALAWLTHGGVAFSFLVLAPWLAWRWVRVPGAWRRWMLAAAVFSVLVAPWIVYQKVYDPPGNRLLKWHLAGQIPIDERGTWETLRANYGALGWNEILASRRENFAMQLRGTWRLLFSGEAASAQARRNEEFLYTGRALTWWLPGVLLAPLAMAWLARRRDSLERWRTGALGLWAAVTIAVWCTLMFIRGDAFVHQGSYAAMIALFVIASASFEQVSRYTLAAVTLPQAATFLFTWTPPTAALAGAGVDAAAAVLALVSGLFLLATVAAAFRAEHEPAAENPAALAATDPRETCSR
jgi:hypothetical protein